MRKHTLLTVVQPRSRTTPCRLVKPRALAAVASVLTVIALALIAVAGSSAAASNAPSARQQREERYVETAILKAINGPACVRERVPATNPGAPPAALLSILGVLRNPPTAGGIPNVISRPLLRSDTDLYVNYVRFARAAFGVDYYVYAAGPAQWLLPPANLPRCLAAQANDFQAELPQIPKALRAATTKIFNAQLRFERDHPRPQRGVGVTLFGADASGGFAFGDATASQIEQGEDWGSGGGGSGGPGTPDSTLFSGIVPDGVATVTFYYPTGRPNGFSHRIFPPETLTMRVVNNVAVGKPMRSSLPPKIVWQSANGTIIKTITSP